ncbi:Cysteine--tRNA ligase [compost metagenome]
MLSTHYRNPLNFGEEALISAEKSVDRIASAAGNVKHRLSLAPDTAGGQVSPELAAKLDAIVKQYHEKMQDDFNTPDAITAVFEWVNAANLALSDNSLSHADLAALQSAFEELNSVLRLVPEAQEEDADDEVERLIEERTEARKAKNWSRSDEIRDILSAMGIILEDTPQGIRWRRK